MIHVDEFIDAYTPSTMANYEGILHAKWFFTLYRLPAILKVDFRKYLSKYELYCTYKGERWRVTGCSRMGDVWLSKDMTQVIGYQERVDVTECNEWSDNANS